MPDTLSLHDVDAVLLDVDGTLVDTTYLHACVWADAFAESGHPLPTADLHALVGKDSEGLIRSALCDIEVAEQLVDELSERHRRLYEPHWPHLRPLPGARLLLGELHAAGRRVVLATSASAPELEALRTALDADDAIDGATSSADVEAGKPAPDVLRAALEVAGVPAGRALFVGDSVWDGEAARRAGIAFVGVLTGGICEHALREAGAGAVYRGVAELRAHLDRPSLLAASRG